MPDLTSLTITLDDGRRLSYAEYGDPDGSPVLYFHGSPGSRLEGALTHEAAVAHQLRIIAPERPGYGNSNFQRGRRFDDWPRDVAALTTALGIDRFAVVGLSGGGPHVVACALAMPERIVAAAIVSGAGPVDAYIARSRSRLGRMLRRVGLPFGRAVIQLGIRILPWALRRTTAERMSTSADRRVLARLDQRERFRTDLLEGLRPGARGAVQEFGLHLRPWPFDLRDVGITIHLWHGEADVIVPIDIGRYVAGHIPDCRAKFVAGEGHLLIVDHIDEILRVVRHAHDVERALAPRYMTIPSTTATTPS